MVAASRARLAGLVLITELAAAGAVCAPGLDATFEENCGQAPAEVRFLSRTPLVTTLLTPEGMRLLHGPDDAQVSLRFVGGRSIELSGERASLARRNFFVGDDSCRWQTGVPGFEAVRNKEVWPGVDVVFHAGRGDGLEYDVVLAPGADPATVRLAFDGARRLRLEGGDLVVELGGREIRQHPPVSWQEHGECRVPVEARFTLAGPREVGLSLGAHDRDGTIVIDPVLTWSTFLGGSKTDLANSVAIDAAGNVFVAGTTSSLNFPLLDPSQATYGGGSRDLYVAKLDPAGQLLFATYFGGSSDESGAELALSGGNVWVTGSTWSVNLPVKNALQPTSAGQSDVFLVELDASGALLYSSYFGGSRQDTAHAIAVAPSGTVFVAGETQSDADLPLQNPLQPAMSGIEDAFIAGFRADHSLLFSTFLGGDLGGFSVIGEHVYEIAVDATGALWVAGQTDSPDFPLRSPLQSRLGGATDAFVARIDPVLPDLLFSTFLGGASSDLAFALDIASSGEIVIAGHTDSADFPTRKPLQLAPGGKIDAFVAGIAGDGSALLFSTWLGGSEDDLGLGVRVKPSGDIVVSGETTSTDFPTRGALQPSNAGKQDGFFATLNPTGTMLLDSSYLGGVENDELGVVALDPAGGILLAGATTSPDYPIRLAWQPAYGGGVEDAVITRLDACAGPLGPVGDSLRIVRDRPAAELVLSWTDVPIATSYVLRDSTAKGTGFPVLAGSASNGMPGLRLSYPPDALLLFNVVGANCGIEGPF